MVYQGVVMEVEKSHIIVLTDNTNYVKLKKKGNIDIGKKIMFIEDDFIRKSNRSFKPLIGIAAAIILVIATIIGQFGIDFMGNLQAYAIVSLDINPSLEFQIDEKEIVKKINSLNKDGREIIDDNMVGMKIEDAIILSIKKAINKQYLNNENNVVLVSDVIIDDNAKLTTVIENEIFQKVEEDKDLQGIELIYVDSDKEDLEKARENQVSVGKYKVYEMVSYDNPNIKIEDIKDKKVSDIVKENKDLTKHKNVKTKKNEKEKNKGQMKKEDKNSKFDSRDDEKKNNGKKNGKTEKESKEKAIKERKDNKKDYQDTKKNEKEDNRSKGNNKNTNNKKSIEENDNKDLKKKNKQYEKNNSKVNIKDEDDDDEYEDDDEDDDDDEDKESKEKQKNRKDNKKDKHKNRDNKNND